tara:strand:- start:191 stop:448 length:258 start_codon:yes stop_codon:yes gene_type:complete
MSDLVEEGRRIATCGATESQYLRCASQSADEIERLRGAIERISKQHLPDEMSAGDYENADWDGAYEYMVRDARSAMSDNREGGDA